MTRRLESRVGCDVLGVINVKNQLLNRWMYFLSVVVACDRARLNAAGRHDPEVDGRHGRVPHFRKPDCFTRNVFNPIVAGTTRLGISVWGSRVLEVRGRRTGTPHQTPVNVLSLGDSRYLVAPRGHTQWVRNLRAAGEGNLILGKRREGFKATEVADADKEPILRAYLHRWKWEVGQFFAGVGPDSPASDLTRIAPDHPVFRIETHP